MCFTIENTDEPSPRFTRQPVEIFRVISKRKKLQRQVEKKKNDGFLENVLLESSAAFWRMPSRPRVDCAYTNYFADRAIFAASVFAYGSPTPCPPAFTPRAG